MRKNNKKKLGADYDHKTNAGLKLIIEYKFRILYRSAKNIFQYVSKSCRFFTTLMLTLYCFTMNV